MMLNYVNEHCTCTYVTAVGRQSEREKEREKERERERETESPCSPRILPSLQFPVTLPSHPISPPFPFPPLHFPPLPSPPLRFPPLSSPLPEEKKREPLFSPL